MPPLALISFMASSTPRRRLRPESALVPVMGPTPANLIVTPLATTAGSAVVGAVVGAVVRAVDAGAGGCAAGAGAAVGAGGAAGVHAAVNSTPLVPSASFRNCRLLRAYTRSQLPDGVSVTAVFPF